LENIKVVKFGGSSLADAEQFKKVKAIVTAEPERRYVVPSAPGKRFKEDDKITDLLYKSQELASKGEEFDGVFTKIRERYLGIVKELGIVSNIEEELDNVYAKLKEGCSKDYAASRGEYLCGLILASYLGYSFIDSAEVILFDAEGNFEAKKTNAVLGAALKRNRTAVIPGFYGSRPDNSINTFSRGGSDVTGALVACACNADLYENWTDVSGFLMADPRIVPGAKIIEKITYRELRELSYMGATVLHEDSIFPVRSSGIPINIRNTNDPSAKGTMIVAHADQTDEENVLTGVAGKKGFSVVTIIKDMMNSELGFVRRVLEVFEKRGISFEHIPSGIDTMSVVLNTSELDNCRESIINNICRVVEPDTIYVDDGLALVAVVGRNMKSNKGTAARVFKSIYNADINIRMIDQGSCELNIIVGVNEEDFEKTIDAIYREFVK